MAQKYFIRDFEEGDEKDISKIFYETIHHINSKDYSPEQLDIWAPKNRRPDEWPNILKKGFIFIAIEEKTNKIVGFSDLRPDGCLEHGFVHKDYQRRGIGTLLLKVREEKALKLGLKIVYSHVSITARPFYLKQGYVVGKGKIVTKKGVNFFNYKVQKNLISTLLS